MSLFRQERELMCEIGRRMYDRQFVAAHEGNLSVRLSDGNVLCTPTMQCKGFLKPEQLCVIDTEMNQVSGDQQPTSEIRLHLEIYRQRPDIGAVVHSHAPHATAFAVANKLFPCGVLAEPRPSDLCRRPRASPLDDRDSRFGLQDRDPLDATWRTPAAFQAAEQGTG